MEKDGELKLCELYDLIRGHINHEDHLVSQRVLWALLPQAFFLGAYVGLLNAPSETKMLSLRRSKHYYFGFCRRLVFLQGCSPILGLFHR